MSMNERTALYNAGTVFLYMMTTFGFSRGCIEHVCKNNEMTFKLIIRKRLSSESAIMTIAYSF